MDFYQMEESNLLRRIIHWVIDIIVVLAIAWFAIISFGNQVKIHGQSMEPLLHSGDVMLINRLVYDLTNPKRFDMVVFQREDQRSNVKRIIGLPGETLQIQGGNIYINGVVLDNKKFLNPISVSGLAENPVVLGSQEYFLLGDNGDSSEDSRFANIGNVQREQIVGKVYLRILPLVRFGKISSEN